MLILDLTYIVPLSEADAHMETHMQWVNDGYAKGLFLASGRKNPRDGGIVIAKGDRAEIEAFCALDPFAVHGIAKYAVTDVQVSRTAEGLEGLKG